jgi:ABC-type uncharacterized transport system substrate-binding protein
LAHTLGLEVQAFEASSPGELASVFAKMVEWRADALSTLNDGMFFSQRERIVELAKKSKLPAVHPEAEFVQACGLGPTERIYPICSGVPHHMWIEF